MTLTRDEAALALSQMQAAQNRTSVLARYTAGGPILMLWGAEWFVCNLVSQYGGAAARWVWPVATVVALALSFALSRRGGSARKGWKALATSITVGAFFFALFAILRLADMQAVNAVISVAVACAYIILGVWTGARYAWLGCALFAAVLIGWVFLPAFFFLWMALVGGGALALGGLWLWKA